MELRAIFLLFILGLLIFGLMGCATVKELPMCEHFTAQGVEHEGKYYAIFDEENIAKLSNTLSGLSKGTCRVE